MTKQKLLYGLYCRDKRMIYEVPAEVISLGSDGKKLLKAVIPERGKLCSHLRPWFQLEVPAWLCVH